VIAPVETWGLATRLGRDGCAKRRSFRLENNFYCRETHAGLISRTTIIEETQYDNISRDNKILGYNISKRTFTTRLIDCSIRK